MSREADSSISSKMMKFQKPKNSYSDTNSEDDPELEHLKKELQFFFEEMESEGPL